ncbi:MAG: glycoside hydrolase family 88 protein [Treponema sp.]|nr:glycoside hydrolase family 88 protein [Treponema sp.]
MSEFDKSKPVSERMSRSVKSRYGTDQMQWHYEHGLVLQSIYLVGLKSGQDDLLQYVKSMYDSKITPAGDILTYRKDEFNLDQVNPGKVLFLLYKKYGEEKYRIAIEKLMDQLRNHPRTKTNGFWHKKIYPFQMWLDGLYMQAPFYAQYTVEFGTPEAFDDIEHQFTLIEKMARDAKTGLLYHAWDESKEMKWANHETGCSPHFWGRALGWYCMALADVLEILPAEAKKTRDALAAISLRLLEPLLNCRDPQTGLWYQVMDKGGESGNYNESSASSMYVYFMTKIIRLSLLDNNESLKARVKEAAQKAYASLMSDKISEDPSGELHLNDICKVAGLGGTPYRDGSYEYYVSEPKATDDFKGVGPFILASLEQEAINR